MHSKAFNRMKGLYFHTYCVFQNASKCIVELYVYKKAIFKKQQLSIFTQYCVYFFSEITIVDIHAMLFLCYEQMFTVPV